MEPIILKKIHSIEKKIEASLNNEDFMSIPPLSLELDKLIKEFTAHLKLKENLSSNDKELQEFLSKINYFKEQTAIIFKKYRSKVSNQTRMHQAYKNT